jgi:hypothetical protein
MPTMTERALDRAESQIGTSEAPRGSNRGARVQAYQASTTLPGTGWPWCAAFICWVWQEAGFDRDLVRRIASPCTATMCSRARGEELTCTPRAGAALVWCGTHVELLHTPLGGSTWRCIGGNTSDGVRWTTRSVSGALIFAPAGLADIAVPRKPAFQTFYYLEDPKADYEVKGPWKKRASAQEVFEGLKPEVKRVTKVVRTGKGVFALRIGEPGNYGPWRGLEAKKNRDRAGKILEKRLGRRLRPWSQKRRVAAAGRAEALGKTT